MEQQFRMEGGGTLLLRQDGPKVHLEAQRELDQRGLYKVWLRGSSGGRMLLGTLLPEGNRLCLRRVVSIGELERVHCWPVERVEAPMTFSFQNREGWHREADPGHYLPDLALRRQIKGPMLYRKGREGFQLAAVFRTDCPIPLESLFCLAGIERLDGKAYLTWSFDEAGNPRVMHKEKSNGQTSFRNGEHPG